MAIDGITASYSVPYIYSTQSAAEVGDDFAVDSSALRTEEVAQFEVMGQTEPVEIDAAAAERFARDFPDILMAQAVVQPQLPDDEVPAIADGASTTVDLLWQGDSPRDEEWVADGAVQDSEDASAMENGGEAGATGASDANETGESDARGQALSEDEQQQVKELKARDQEVRTHEQAHMAVGGQYSGGVSYEYQQGPDGARYAVGGEVSIDTSTEREPEATIAKMRQVRAAALAPADPSGQDRAVAAAASSAMVAAQKELSAQKTEEAQGTGSEENGEGGEGEGMSGVEESASSSEIDNGSGFAGGGVASLKSNNPYANAYAGRGEPANAPLQLSSYRPIDIVA